MFILIAGAQAPQGVGRAHRRMAVGSGVTPVASSRTEPLDDPTPERR